MKPMNQKKSSFIPKPTELDLSITIALNRTFLIIPSPRSRQVSVMIHINDKNYITPDLRVRKL